MTETLSILGSTGSIGRQTLDVADRLGLRVAAITGNQNVALLERQARKYAPRLAVAYNAASAADLRVRLADTAVRVEGGLEGLEAAASLNDADTVVSAVVGTAGLRPTLAALRAKKRLALANKETLVCAGDIVMSTARETGAEIVPVDSEHAAIFQCLQGSGRGEVEKLILTASGGPFFGRTRAQLAAVTPAEALKHPNWSMGAKVTIDSATMMNKGLELIEAMHLFSVAPEDVEIVVQRESVIHSMVQFRDGAVLAQLGVPDMHLPIQYALTFPARRGADFGRLDFGLLRTLTFARPDEDTFGCLRIARAAAGTKGTACAVMNAANETAVARFLRGEIGFLDIEARIRDVMARMGNRPASSLGDILAADEEARRLAAE
ncbi:MAG TPA: 1-deoxy-D-xylulose-5-phosphate reductoisomerase [Oscillospiraceae bacterium]|nr:1-deoxy-D-xylulose-5-phosphate reductoisomerase [Oscillospiraceae bacterium]